MLPFASPRRRFYLVARPPASLPSYRALRERVADRLTLQTPSPRPTKTQARLSSLKITYTFESNVRTTTPRDVAIPVSLPLTYTGAARVRLLTVRRLIFGTCRAQWP